MYGGNTIMNIRIKTISAILSAALLFSACSGKSDKPGSFESVDTAEKVFEKDGSDSAALSPIRFEEVSDTEFDMQRFASDYNDYSFELMSAVLDSEDPSSNMMISPASVMIALDLCAAGAGGDTLSELTDLVSEGADPLEQQAFASYMSRKINDSEGVDFSCANAMWINSYIMPDGIDNLYYDYVHDIFEAEARARSFDSDTVDEINEWVDDNTDGMIDRIINYLDPDTAMILVNAIAFEGQWADQYDDYQVQDETFHAWDGTDRDVRMLNGTEESFYETDKATGFCKLYNGGEYCFLVILPSDEDISANEFLSEFSGEDYTEFINSISYDYDVRTKLPEFNFDCDISLSSVLKTLGVNEGFDSSNTDFTGIGNPVFGNLYIGDVLHKTHIELDQNGTRAAAVTAVVMEANGIFMEEPQIREVYCDRPFVYVIADTENMNPVFIGTYNG